MRTYLSNTGPGDRLEYVVVTNRNLSIEDQGYLADIQLLGRSKFGERFDVDSISIETIYRKLEESETAASDRLTVSLKTSVASSGDKLLIGATALTSIFKFMQDYKAVSGDLDLLYEKNVRKFLGSTRKVNKGIEHTLEECPERFGLYNSGVTIVAEKVRVTSEDLVSPTPTS